MSPKDWWPIFKERFPELSEEAGSRLVNYATLLETMAYPLGLTNLRERDPIFERHLLDSLELLPYLPAGPVLDIGTGAGLPGLPLKIARPQEEFWLVDSRRKAISFLEYVIASLKLTSIKVLKIRLPSPDLPQGYFKAAVSRAVTETKILWSLAQPLLVPGGKLLVLKGPKVQKELQELRDLKLEVRIHSYRLPSGRSGKIVEILKGSPS